MGKKWRNKAKGTTSSGRRTSWLKVIFQAFPYVFLIVFIGSLLGASYAFAVQGDLFTVKKVVIPGYEELRPKEQLSFVGVRPGQSIFSLDLLQTEHYIKKYHPEYDSARVHRVLPNQIMVELYQREIVAIVQWDKNYWIDGQAVIVDPPLTPQDVPVIRGLPKPKGPVSIGSRIHYPMLSQALKILDQIRIRRVLGNHFLNHLDVSDAKNLILRIDNTLDVYLGSRDLADKIMKLESVLRNGGLEIDARRVKYLDLRFEDLVIGPR